MVYHSAGRLSHRKRGHLVTENGTKVGGSRLPRKHLISGHYTDKSHPQLFQHFITIHSGDTFRQGFITYHRPVNYLNAYQTCICGLVIFSGVKGKLVIHSGRFTTLTCHLGLQLMTHQNQNWNVRLMLYYQSRSLGKCY